MLRKCWRRWARLDKANERARAKRRMETEEQKKMRLGKRNARDRARLISQMPVDKKNSLGKKKGNIGKRIMWTKRCQVGAIQLKLSVREKECKRPGQTNITNSAKEKWALLWKIAKLRMRTEMEEQFYTTLFHFIITWCNNTNKYNWSSLAHLCWKEHIPSCISYMHIMIVWLLTSDPSLSAQ